MKDRLLRICTVAVSLSASGCITLPEPAATQDTRAREDFLILQESIQQLRGRIEGIELEQERLRNRLDASRAEQAGATSAQIEALRAKTAELESRLRTLDAAREKDRQEIVDSLSRKISQIVTAPATSPSRSSKTPKKPASGEGYEHVVQAGETLSAIAAAYGVRSSDIIEANDLKKPDQLRAGQKLFIPAP
jgi:LysM repeat protein